MTQDKELADVVLAVLSDRKGFDDWWDQLDEELQQEIKAELTDAIDAPEPEPAWFICHGHLYPWPSEDNYCGNPEDHILLYTRPAPARPTVPDQMQDWAGMEGAIAFHLIERHADNWADTGKMMAEWLAANQSAPTKPLTEDQIAELHRDAYTTGKAFTTIEVYRYFARAIEAAHGITE